MRAIERMNLLELIHAGEIEDYTGGVALERLRSGLLHMHVAGQRCRAKEVAAAGEEEFGLVGAAVQL